MGLLLNRINKIYIGNKEFGKNNPYKTQPPECLVEPKASPILTWKLFFFYFIPCSFTKLLNRKKTFKWKFLFLRD